VLRKRGGVAWYGYLGSSGEGEGGVDMVLKKVLVEGEGGKGGKRGFVRWRRKVRWRGMRKILWM